MRSQWVKVAAAAVLFSCLAWAQSGKVESIGPASDTAIPQAVRQVLEANGYRVTLDDGSVACEIWLRKGVPAQAKQTTKDAQGALYSQLAESTLVAVISFPQAATDYRGQAIAKGFYNLRYELIPNDGNHLGVSPNRDFLLLVPSGADTDPATVYKFQELVALSRKATGTRHPGPLNMAPGDSASKTPSVAKDEEDHWVFSATLKLASGDDLPFALVVRGTAPQ